MDIGWGERSCLDDRFDNGDQETKLLDGDVVNCINSNLSGAVDITEAKQLQQNCDIAFMGDTQGGGYDINQEVARKMLSAPNPHGRPTSDVIVPWINGSDITGRPRGMFIVDFGIRSEEDAAQYEKPFEYIRKEVWPIRSHNNREAYRKYWWRHVEARPGMYDALKDHPRFLCTPRVSKHRLFVWLRFPTLADSATFVFARSDDYFFGVVHSRIHEVWSRAQGTQVRERESGFRYTATTCFETFPFPTASADLASAVTNAAENLNRLRTNWA